MSYFVQFDDTRVLDYLAAVDMLCDEDRNLILSAIRLELGRDADKFLHRRALAPESYHFEYDYPHPLWSAEQMLEFRFVCDGSNMASGVVRVVFVDYRQRSFSELM